jgi:hypothetical protein
MKDYNEIITDIKNYKRGLARLYETVHTCNELHEYVSKIIHYIRINDIDEGRRDPYAPQLEVHICTINPKLTYAANTSKSKRTFRTAQHEVDVVLGVMISNFEYKIKSDTP